MFTLVDTRIYLVPQCCIIPCMPPKNQYLDCCFCLGRAERVLRDDDELRRWRIRNPLAQSKILFDFSWRLYNLPSKTNTWTVVSVSAELSRLQHVDYFMRLWSYCLCGSDRIVYCFCICFCMAMSETTCPIDRITQHTHRVLWPSKY